MSAVCARLHELTRRGTLHSFPFDTALLPRNGIYVLFEGGEVSHDGNRIVRVGTHTGEGQLRSRLRQHFVKENKDRSIFRKNIGRCILNRASDPFLAEWELDRTTRAARQLHGAEKDIPRRQAVESDVTMCLREHFSFVVFRVDEKVDRLSLESKMISTLSLCEQCQPSKGWLGLSSPKSRIRENGLWVVNQLFKEPLTHADFDVLTTLLT